jgi:nitronate monooxygenase
VVMVPEVRNLVDEMGKEKEVAAIAAGGIVDGRGLVAALGLGKFCCCSGFRFIYFS